ncbi:MAG: hypothetical protein WCB96_07265 [Candidatus Aminicenantales bacterium]
MKKALLWVLAVLLTLASAVYQRMTGPTNPLRGKVTLCGKEISFRLERSAENKDIYKVKVRAPEPVIGFVEFMRFKQGDEWKPEKGIPMIREGETLVAPLAWPPSDSRPPLAGKIAHAVFLTCGRETVSLTGARPTIIRFKGSVPDCILIPHILVMFLAMLTAVRGGLEALSRQGRTRIYALWTVVLLFIGGFILGPLVQRMSFGQWWTGIPFGFDLTDNKTLIAFIGWLAALLAGRKGRNARWWVLAAAVLMLIVYLIPHSLLGSELDYSKVVQ